jgi:predicted transcriptional regulator
MAADVLIESQQDGGVYLLSDEGWAAIQEGMAQARRGEFASAEEMEALWNR